MPLEPHTEAVLRGLAEAGLPPLDGLPPEEARRVFNPAFAAAAGAKEPLAHVEDVAIASGGARLRARLYVPEGDGPHPALVHLHGGGWVMLDLETHDPYCRALANRSGCAVLSVDYRLAPEHRFPAALDDAYAALCWVSERGAERGLDPTRLGVLGDSAGGNLAAALALVARDRGGPTLRAQLLTYPAVDARMESASIQENAEGFLLTASAMRWFWDHYRGPTPLETPYLSPLHAEDVAKLPPALIVTAEYDPLRDEGEAYARRLEQAGVSVELQRYDGTIHGFVLLAGAIPAGQRALEAQARFARQRLRD